MTIIWMGNTVGYVTTDEVNPGRALDIGDRLGLRVDVVAPKELPRPEADALVFDLDLLGLDARGRRDYLARIAAMAEGRPVAPAP